MFLSYVHAFRGIAILFIVLAHAKFLVVWPQTPSVYDNVLHAVNEGGTVLFVFIAGFLFQHLSPRFDYRTYLSSKLRNVILPYLVCSLPILLHSYVFRYGLFAHRDRTPLPLLAWEVAAALVTAQHMFIPFWFIPAIAIIYLLAPVLIELDRRPHLYAFVPLLLLLAPLMHLSTLYVNVVQDAANLLPVYMLGMMISHYREPALAWLHRYRHLLIATVIALIGVDAGLGQGGRINSLAPFSTENGVFDATMLQKVIFSLWLFERLASWDRSGSGFHPVVLQLLSTFADLSFGIFFIHMYVVTYLMEPALERIHHPLQADFLPLLAMTSLCLALTVPLVKLVKRITGQYSRYMVGC